jgi:hypothetical protein
VVVLGEDLGHRQFVSALVARLAREQNILVDTESWNPLGAQGSAVLLTLRRYLHALTQGTEPVPDCLVIAKDGNCRGFLQRRQEIERLVPLPFQDRLVYAIPDPHVERWLLLDSAAFRAAVGRGCPAPDRKCERDRYKHQLDQAIRAAGRQPLAGGIEYTEPIVAALDLRKVSRADPSLGSLVEQLEDKLKEWSRA